jgi:hypothetical protein
VLVRKEWWLRRQEHIHHVRGVSLGAKKLRLIFTTTSGFALGDDDDSDSDGDSDRKWRTVKGWKF